MEKDTKKSRSWKADVVLGILILAIALGIAAGAYFINYLMGGPL